MLPNQGKGVFGAAMLFPISQPNPSQMVAGDWNGDGKPDLAVINIKYTPGMNGMPDKFEPEVDVILNTTM